MFSYNQMELSNTLESIVKIALLSMDIFMEMGMSLTMEETVYIYIIW